MKEQCSNCKYHRRLDFVDWYCGNPDSPHYNKETESFDTCDQFEEWSDPRSPKRT